MGRRQREDSVMSDYVRDRLTRLVAEIRTPAEAVDQATVLRPRTGPVSDGPQPEPVRRRPDPGTQPDPGTPADPEPSDPDPARGRGPSSRFTRTHLLVLAVVLLLGAVAAGYALTRARAIEVAEPLPIQAAGPSGPAPAPTQQSGPVTPSPIPVTVRIHVVGEVTRPGVHTLPAGARVIDAITAAGGLTPAARPGELNLAQVLSDGQQVLVGGGTRPGGEVRGGAAASGPGAGTGAAQALGGKLNLNTATVEQFDALPGVGPVTAQKIIAWRTQRGRFSRIEELQEVPGIGPKSYADLAPLVTV